MDFDESHIAFIDLHLKKRTGERKGRLKRGHREAEKLFLRNVWWPLHENFSHLHPEYEVLDWRGRPYYCDFVCVIHSIKLVIEIKGFVPHVQDMDRLKYCNELNRETFLTAVGFEVISFAYDDVAHRPELCIMLLRMVLSRYLPTQTPNTLHHVMEREIIKLACMLVRPLRPIDVVSHLGLNHRTAVRALQLLCEKGFFSAISGAEGKHTVRYQLQHIAIQQL